MVKVCVAFSFGPVTFFRLDLGTKATVLLPLQRRIARSGKLGNSFSVHTTFITATDDAFQRETVIHALILQAFSLLIENVVRLHGLLR